MFESWEKNKTSLFVSKITGTYQEDIFIFSLFMLIFPPKIQISPVISTYWVLDYSGRSVER